MYTTNKKFVNTKNLPAQSTIFSKQNPNKNKPFDAPLEQGCEPKQMPFSDTYEPEDQYADLTEVFLKGKFDVAFQNYNIAFPAKPAWKLAKSSKHNEAKSKQLLRQFSQKSKQFEDQLLNSDLKTEFPEVDRDSLFLNSLKNTTQNEPIPLLEIEGSDWSDQDESSTMENSFKTPNQTEI